MEMTKTPSRIHPLVAAASVSVMLVSLVGVAAITGILPTSHGTAAPAAPVAAVTAPAQNAPADEAAAASSIAKPSTTVSKLAETEAPASVPAKTARPAVKHHKTTSHPLAPNYAQTASAPQSAPTPVYAPAPTQIAQAPAPAPAQICHSCGRVEAVNAVQTQAAPSGLGVVAGGVVGGLLGNQVGGGNGRTLATVAGAVGGGFAGNEIEKRTRGTTAYQVRVRMEDGHIRTFPYNNQPHWAVGDRVKVVDGYLTAQG